MRVLLHNFTALGNAIGEVITLAKRDKKQLRTLQVKPHNDTPPVPELQGPAKLSNHKAKPITEK